MNISDIKKHILNISQEVIQNALGKQVKNLSITYPPDVKFGDFSVEFFSAIKDEAENISKNITKEEKNIYKKKSAENIQQAIKKITNSFVNVNADDVIEKVDIIGPYANFKIKKSVLFGSVLSKVIEKDDSFGCSDIKVEKKVMVEYLSPNTNKPLHLGHLRNGSLGMAISNILSFCGVNVIKANLVNDRGIHICKSMLAWQKWGNGEIPESTGIKGDHFVGKWYVRYNQEEEKNPSLVEENKNMLKKWEEGDRETLALWKKMNDWVYEGFAETYKNFGLKFDKYYHESETYKLGKDIIEGGLIKGVFQKDENGSIIYSLPEEFGKEKDGSDKKATILRADRTSLYLTQDLGTAVKKVEDHNLDKSIYIVGSEQVHHFKCLFEILKALGYKWAKNCYHLSYGMVYLPEGKMKSREGKIVDADDLIKEVEKIVSEEIKKRNPKISNEELQNRAHIIGIGAIKFHLLRVTPNQDIHFDPKESVALDGFTGPYCQYAYVRAQSILRGIENFEDEIKDADFSLLGEREEMILLQKIIQFQETVKLALNEMNPSRITNHVFEIAQSFNQFYQKHPVLNTENEQIKKARLALVKATSIVIKNDLHLLGIETVEKM